MGKKRRINRLENDKTVVERTAEPTVVEEQKVVEKAPEPVHAEESISVKRKRVIPGSVRLLKKRTTKFF